MTWPCECALKFRTAPVGQAGLAVVLSMAWLLIVTVTDPLWGAEPQPATALPTATVPCVVTYRQSGQRNGQVT